MSSLHEANVRFTVQYLFDLARLNIMLSNDLLFDVG